MNSKRYPNPAQPMLSEHSLLRINERQLGNPEIIHQIILKCKGAHLGISQKSVRKQILHWNPMTQQPMIAIQNIINLDVVTILTLDQYDRQCDYPEVISDELMQKVINESVLLGFEPDTNKWKPSEIRNLLVAITLFDPRHNFQSLGEYIEPAKSLNLTYLREDPQFLPWIASKLEGKENLDISKVDSILARIRQGDSQIIYHADISL